jgi:anti-sigma regulatory factor (Ser/Thr protein kinase)
VHGYRRPAASIDGGTGAVLAGSGRALPASAIELGSGAGTASQSWPLASPALPLAALATAPACARGHVRSIAHEWGFSEIADTAELLTSELTTNAVQASQRLRIREDSGAVPVVRLWLRSNRASLVICVWDGHNEMPVRKEASADSEAGRGLMLVDALAKEWGAFQEEGGKVVWAMLTVADP